MTKPKKKVGFAQHRYETSIQEFNEMLAAEMRGRKEVEEQRDKAVLEAVNFGQKVLDLKAELTRTHKEANEFLQAEITRRKALETEVKEQVAAGKRIEAAMSQVIKKKEADLERMYAVMANYRKRGPLVSVKFHTHFRAWELEDFPNLTERES